MRIAFLTTAALLALATGAQAADMSPRSYTKAPPMAPIFSWTGFYLGAHGGYGFGSDSNNIKGGFGGGQVGYNYQTGNVVFGVEADVAGGSLKDSVSIDGGNIFGTTKIDAFGTVRGRIGYAFDHALLYGTGGFAWAHNKVSVSDGVQSASDDKTHTGWTAGAGFEYAFLPNWSAKVEYLYTDYSSENYNFGGLPVSSGDLKVNTIKIGVNYLFH